MQPRSREVRSGAQNETPVEQNIAKLMQMAEELEGKVDPEVLAKLKGVIEELENQAGKGGNIVPGEAIN